jgi:hypothetical protein
MSIAPAQLTPILDEFVTANPSPHGRQTGSVFDKVSFDDLDDSARCQLAKFFIHRNTPYIGMYSGNFDAPQFLARAAEEIATWPMGSEVSGRRLEHIAYAVDVVSQFSFTTPSGALASVYLLHQLEFFFRKLSGVLHADGSFINQNDRPQIRQQLGERIPSRINDIALAYKIMLLRTGIMAVDTFRELDQQSRNTPMPDGSTIKTVGDRVTYFRHTVSHGEFGDPSAEGTYYGLLTAIATYGSAIFPRK